MRTSEKLRPLLVLVRTFRYAWVGHRAICPVLPKNQYIHPPKSNCMSVEYPLSTPSSDERTLGILSHILAIIPGIGILGPLVIFLIKKDSQFVGENARESLNFQITVYLAGIVFGILTTILIGFALLALLVLANFVLVIVATIKASENKIYRYPFTLRLIK
jgi:uncharacterized protein